MKSPDPGLVLLALAAFPIALLGGCARPLPVIQPPSAPVVVAPLPAPAAPETEPPPEPDAAPAGSYFPAPPPDPPAHLPQRHAIPVNRHSAPAVLPRPADPVQAAPLNDPTNY